MKFAFIFDNFEKEQKSVKANSKKHNTWKYWFIYNVLLKMHILCNFMLSYQIYFHLYSWPHMLIEIIGDLPVDSNITSFLQNFLCGTQVLSIL